MVNVALVQLAVTAKKEENIRKAEMFCQKTAMEGADIVVLPEMFCCPYDAKNFPVYGEQEGGFVWQALAEMAKTYGIYLVGGSMPEIGAEGNVYNTSYVFDRRGRQIGKHRKMHLFDIDVAGGQQFRESDTLTAGEDITVFDTEFGKMGLCICYDIRFPELARLMVEQGAKGIFGFC